jgi:hypothetical protein
MTVLNVNYSSLDEVWADAPSKPKRKEKKKDSEARKVPDPICELYEMGNYRGYTENDIVSYANEYLEKQNPSRKHHDSEDVEHDDDESIIVPPVREPAPRLKRESFTPPPQRRAYQEEETYSSRQDFAFIDLLLYVISGIILIFAMEQFVKIGVLLQ